MLIAMKIISLERAWRRRAARHSRKFPRQPSPCCLKDQFMVYDILKYMGNIRVYMEFIGIYWDLLGFIGMWSPLEYDMGYKSFDMGSPIGYFLANLMRLIHGIMWSGIYIYIKYTEDKPLALSTTGAWNCIPFCGSFHRENVVLNMLKPLDFLFLVPVDLPLTNVERKLIRYFTSWVLKMMPKSSKMCDVCLEKSGVGVRRLHHMELNRLNQLASCDCRRERCWPKSMAGFGFPPRNKSAWSVPQKIGSGKGMKIIFQSGWFTEMFFSCEMSVRDTSRVRFQDPSVASSCQIPWKKRCKNRHRANGTTSSQWQSGQFASIGGPPKSPI